jgi:hypothetical protein
VLLSGTLQMSEFLAVNNGGLADEDGDHSDWIEVRNVSAAAVNLDGWYLTDRADELREWRFPAKTLAAGQYLVVFASGKDRTNPAAALHTNFSLDGAGQYLALVRPDGVTIEQQFAPTFPAQHPDVSYGLVGTPPPALTPVSAGSLVSYHVPALGEDPFAWTAAGFNDSSWTKSVTVNAAEMLITEVCTGDKKVVEVQNASDHTASTAGWRVLANDASVGINAVQATAWALPASLTAGGVLYRTSDPADGANYWGSGLNWTATGNGWVMIVNATGAVMDFVAWGYTAAQIAAMDASFGTFSHLNASGQWSGNGAAAGTTGGSGGSQWVAFNDYLRGATTSANATSYDAYAGSADPASGFMKDISSGQTLAATLTVTGQSITFEGSQGGPASGTDAYNIFHGYVDFGSGNGSSLAMASASSYTYAFTGLDTGDTVTYNFAGTAARGGGYTKRWTKVSLVGAVAATAASTAYGNGVVVIDATDVAIWTGENNLAGQGYVAAWTNIDPGADGAFSVVTSLYSGAIPTSADPGGVANDGKAYAATAVRLEAAGSAAQTWVRRSGSTDGNSAGDFARAVAGNAGTQNQGMTVPFGTTTQTRVGIGFGTSQPAFDANIQTNVQSAIKGVNSSIWTRLTFDGTAMAGYDELTLRMKYDDGFVAYLNGTEVARRNATGAMAWNSAASGQNGDANAVVFESIDISQYANLLRTGTNVLAIDGLNISAGDGDFLLVPELLVESSLQAQMGYFLTPTPGVANGAKTDGFVADTKFDHDRGFYNTPFDVVITCATPGAQIRYTLDASTPTATTGLVYGGPIHVTTTTTLRAAAFLTGYVGTDVDTETFIFVASVINQGNTPAGYPTVWGSGTAADYAMDPKITTKAAYSGIMDDSLLAIPTLSLVTDISNMFGPSGIYITSADNGVNYPEVAASAELIYPDGTKGFQINAGLTIQGGAGRDPNKSPEHSLRLHFEDIYGASKLNFPLFPDAGATTQFDSLMLRAGYNNSWIHSDGTQRAYAQYVRDEWTMDTARAMGDPAPYCEYVQLYTNGMYWGLYDMAERPDEAWAASYFGGQKEDYLGTNAGDWTGVPGNNPTLQTWNAMFALANTAINSGTLTDTAYQQMQKDVDVTSFADYMILQQFGGNQDWGFHNWYAVRNQTNNGPFYFISWDSERIFEDVTTNMVTATDGSNCPERLFASLKLNAEFRQLVADRVHKFLFNDGALTTQKVIDRWNVRSNQVYLPVVAESARWGDYRTPATPLERDVQWAAERTRLLNSYFPYRTANMITEYRTAALPAQPNAVLYPTVAMKAEAPELAQTGGRVSPGYKMTLTNPNGVGTVVYYMLDGSDPRLVGGAVNPAARVYTAPVTLPGNSHVKARVLNGTTWSALTEADFVVGTPTLAVTEIMYSPADPSAAEKAAGFIDNDDFEFLELRNTGTVVQNLIGLKFTDGITLRLPDWQLAPGAYAVVVRNRTAFNLRYPAAAGLVVAEYRGQLDDSLSNSGEELCLQDALGGAVLDFRYKDSWYDITDGGGFSLELIDPATPVADYSLAERWMSSAYLAGTPGAGDADAHAPGAVVINEVLANPTTPGGDWIELHNTTSLPIGIGGWYLSASDTNLKQYHIAAGTTIPANGYVLFTQAANFGNPADPGTITAFDIGATGGVVCLSSGDASGQLGGYRAREDFGASDAGVPFARYVKSSGGKDFVAAAAPTPGQPNGLPLVGPVVIDEIMYDPAADGDEYIELRNISASPVGLWDPYHGGSSWKLGVAVTFTFPPERILAPGERALVVGIDPQTFRARHGLDGSIQIFGPWSGTLDNAGERIELLRPSIPSGDGTVPYVLVEKVNYDTQAPWPTGLTPGVSLERVSGRLYGNDAVNWRPGPVGGTPGLVNQAAVPEVVRMGRNDGLDRPGKLTALAFTFNKDLPAGVVAGNLVLTDAAGQPVNLAAAGFAYDSATRTARWDLAGLSLGAGYYIATLAAASLVDANQTPLDGDGDGQAGGDYRVVLQVALPGDGDLDGLVGEGDLAILDGHFGQSSAGWAQGDWDGDGVVGAMDYLILKQNMGRTIGSPPALPALPAAPLSAPAAAALSSVIPLAEAVVAEGPGTALPGVCQTPVAVLGERIPGPASAGRGAGGAAERGTMLALALDLAVPLAGLGSVRIGVAAWVGEPVWPHLQNACSAGDPLLGAPLLGALAVPQLSVLPAGRAGIPADTRWG